MRAALFLALVLFAEEPMLDFVIGDEEQIEQVDLTEEKPCSMPVVEPVAIVKTSEKNWYFEFKPGYYYLTDSTMQQIFNNGGFTIRGEAGYRLYGPLVLWFDGGYFYKKGHSLGGYATSKMTLATLSLGLKAVWDASRAVSLYAGAGPRLFLMMMNNDSEYVNAQDNAIGLGGAFQGGLWLFPTTKRNFFFDLFVDYSLKTLTIEPDPVSSDDFDVNVSGLSLGLGIGFKF